MGVTVIVVITAVIFVWGTVAARLVRADLSAPIVFTVVGALLAFGGLVETPSDSVALRPLVEITLVWVLFSDAARIRVQDLRPDLGQYVRLLGVGLPLTILAGWLLALWLFPGAGMWLALLIAAALAPTDAALGVPVVTNPVVPARIRRLITVESGLNDGISTPVVMLAIAVSRSPRASERPRASVGRWSSLRSVRRSASGSDWAAAGCCASRAAASGRPRTSPASRSWPSPCLPTPPRSA